jgi:hypothetical protein
MAIFAKPSQEEQAAKAAQKEEKAREKAEAEWFASPPGQAQLAKEAGDAFFQVEIQHKTITGHANAMWASNTSQRQRASKPASDILGMIEAEGRRLEQASWVYVQTGQNSRDKFLASGQQVVVQGEVVGIYLFRNTDS